MSRPQRFANKNVVVTGASTGLGFTTAQSFIEEGARVIITGKDEARLAAAAQRLGPNAIAVRGDVRKMEDLDALAQKARESFGHVDVLFANAGLGRFAPIELMDEATYDEQFHTNVKGLYFTVQKLLGLMKSGSNIILNSSAVNTKGFAMGGVYIATKAAVRSLARSMAAELGPRGIRVNSISPGMIPTEFQGKMGIPPEGVEGLYANIRTVTPLGRLGFPNELARAVLFLASDEASFVSAVDLAADGGWMNI